MKLEKLKPGMTVYDVGRQRMGNTTMRTVAVWGVFIRSVDLEKRTVVASWNSNPDRTFSARAASKWKAVRPMLVRTGMGALRLATREEQAAANFSAKTT